MRNFKEFANVLLDAHMKEANKVVLSFMFFFFLKVKRFIVTKSLLQNLLYAPTTIIHVCYFIMGIKILDFYTHLFVLCFTLL
jgi:hypothetical protein